MIIGIVPDASTAEILLNNLSEADFNLHDVSLIMRDQKLRDKIIKASGPLKGVNYSQVYTRLVKAGLSGEDARVYQDALAKGKVLVAMNISPDVIDAAKEMFSDHSAEFIKEVTQ